MAEFEGVVLRWLQEVRPELGATSLEVVQGYGTDWRGSTEEGFGPEFEVRVCYYVSDGASRWCDVRGEDLQGLWMAVVAGWPATIDA